MISRRDYLKLALASGAALSLQPRLLWAQDGQQPLITRLIPSTGEQLPVVGLGSSATFSQKAGSQETEALREVLTALVEHRGSVFDTAPGYGASEEVAGRLVDDMDAAERVFWATKLNVAPRGGGKADVDAARRQLETSFERSPKDVIDLIQVHNLGDMAVQFPLLKELKQQERVRYIGVTTTFPQQYEQLEQVMRSEPLDFIGIDYAIDNRTMEERIFPLAEERGIAVMVYAPFGRTRLWDRVRGQELPAWAAELGIHSWAQFFLKFVISHPVVTVATPATGRARHMVDNMGAAFGELPDERARARMIAHIESL